MLDLDSICEPKLYTAFSESLSDINKVTDHIELLNENDHKMNI